MEIRIADKAGFCFGVDRAVKIAYDTAKQDEKKIFTYGMLIHNRDVTRDLENMGVQCAECLDDIPEGAAVIIRAHGISEAEYKRLEEKSVRIIDATCPYVKRIHKIVKEEHEKGCQVVIAGDCNHPEVKGINGWCQNSAVIIGVDENYDEILTKGDEICISLVAQTTMRKEKVKNIEKNLNKHFTNVKFFDTIYNIGVKNKKNGKKNAVGKYFHKKIKKV